MAENVLKKLEEHVQCSICLDTYKNPKVLQCHHVFCRSCLFEILIGYRGKPLTYLECPACRVRTELPSGDVDDLQSAFHMSGVLEIRSEFGNVEDLSSLQNIPTSLKEPVRDCAEPSVCFCTDHEEQEVKLYCDYCAVTICFLCAISGGKHHSHQYSILSEAYQKYEKDIEASMTSLDEGIKGIVRLLDQLEAGAIGIGEQGEAVRKEIGDAFQEIHGILNARENQLVGSLQGAVRRKLKIISARRDELETLQAKASGRQSIARENLAAKNETELLRVKTKIAEQVEEVSNELLPHVSKLDVLTTDLVFKSSAKLSEVCQQFGRIVVSGSPDPIKCYVTGFQGVQEVGRKASFLLNTVDSSGEPCSEDVPCVCGCEVVSKELETSAMCSCPGSVEKIGLSEYEISCTLTQCGSSEIHVKVNGGHVKGSPFPVIVAKKRNEVGLPFLKDVDGLGIAIRPGSQEVAVTSACCISVYNRTGKYMLSFGKPGFGKGDLNKPYGLVFDNNGDIVVADHFNGRVQKFNMRGVFVASAGAKGTGPLQFDHPYDVAFNANNKRLYVIDNTCVQILSTALSYTGCFGKRGKRKGEFSTPHGIDCDSFGNVYVADSGNHRIQVFAPGGKFLKLFGKHGSREGELGFPVAVAISDTSLLYVSERENRRVSIFTNNGKFLSLLENRTDRTVCRFVSPRGIAIDPSGVRYVCDDKRIVKV